MLLATDLDGTFLGGKSFYKQQLYQIIRESKNIRLAFVTGRGLKSVIPLFNDPLIPNPDYIICDVGATIVTGHPLKPIEPLQSEIEKRWPGSAKILESLSHIPGIRHQDVPQKRRCSFYTNNDSVACEIRFKVEELGCDMIYSANKFLDILPKGVNKGTSLKRLVNHLRIDHSEVLVAGDTLNDLEMYQFGFKGVVVGGAEEKLVNDVKNIQNIYCAELTGAGGILMGMEHFGYIEGFIKDEKVPLFQDNKVIPSAVI